MQHLLIPALSLIAAALIAGPAPGQESAAETQPVEEPSGDRFAFPLEVPKTKEGPGRQLLIEEFTAETLPAGAIKIGSDLEFGMTDSLMIGTDIVALGLGASSLQVRYKINEGPRHQFALGVRSAYLTRETLLWGSFKDHFDELEAKIVRPSVSWSHTVSPRLKIHSFWAKGFGKINASLSEKGRRRLWEAKHPGEDYDARDQETQEPATVSGDTTDPADTDNADSDKNNKEREAGKRTSVSQQSIQVQSIAGLAQERFQLSGEFARKGGNKVLVSSRIEQSQFEELKSKFFRLTAAHHWIWSKFQMRLGVGVQYYVISGTDLDGEKIDEAGVGPASDIVFYWIL
jgi:hypothetical protein